MFEQVQKAQHRKLLGIEMEAYGVMCAADDLPTPQPRAIVLKGVSDFADSAKSDAFREYAAYVSAGAAVYLCEQQEI
jgi:nucleoside phosphorylase